MVRPAKTAHTALALATVPWLAFAGGAAAADPPPAPTERMVVITGKDVSGTIYKKLGLPSLKYCWDLCIQDQPCTGARWGVIEGDVAGLCVMLSGELSVKELTTPRTEDGKAIRVIAARKQSVGDSGGGT
jgi:hypothetical protein